MNSGKTESKKNQTTRFAKVALLLVLLAVAVAGATIYQESKPNSPNYAASNAATHTGADTQAAQPFMQGEPFSRADAVVELTYDLGTSIWVDGQPMVLGDPIPAHAFTVSWAMDKGSPFGRDSVELTGGV